MRTLIATAALGLLVGCGNDDEPAPTADLSAEISEASETYTGIVIATYEDSLELARVLDERVHDFLDDPSEDALNAAREAWRAAREPYLQSEAFRFYDGPIDDPDTGPEGLINAWPMDESYIDYVLDGDEIEEGGIVNDPEIDIDADTLEGLNEDGGEENIATGYHAVEFLLWGQDHSDTGPGDRPYTDYLEGDDATAENADRRAAYLRTVSGLIVTHLEELSEAWEEGQSSNYHHDFEEAAPNERLRRILTGLIVLTGFETGGERLQTALDSGSQEDEHSCFSDNTHRDMIQDIRGVKNVWTGDYARIDGSHEAGFGVRDVVELKDAALAAALDDRIDQSLELAEALHPPFDQEIQVENAAGRERVRALITSLRAQERLLEDVFRKFALNVPVPE